VHIQDYENDLLNEAKSCYFPFGGVVLKFLLILNVSTYHIPVLHFQIKLSFLMVGHTHEDVDQMFSRLSVHLSRKSIPTLPVVHSLMMDAYHPTPVIKHLDGLWDYRKLEWLLLYP
jgi:hypothetical protein